MLITRRATDRGLERNWTTAGGYRIRWWSGGELREDGLPIVLVHGLGMSSLYMLPTAEELAGNFRVFVPDLPGFGASDKPRQTLDLAQLAAALDAWLEAVSMPRAVFVGNSLGCQVLIELAHCAPQRIAGLVLQGPTIDRTAPTASGQVLRLVRDAFRERISLLLIGVLDYCRAGWWRVYRTLRHALAHPMVERLAALPCPTLVVHGTRDPIVTGEWAKSVAAQIPSARLVELDGPHALNYSRPRELAELIERFIFELRSGIDAAKKT